MQAGGHVPANRWERTCRSLIFSKTTAAYENIVLVPMPSVLTAVDCHSLCAYGHFVFVTNCTSGLTAMLNPDFQAKDPRGVSVTNASPNFISKCASLSPCCLAVANCKDKRARSRELRDHVKRESLYILGHEFFITLPEPWKPRSSERAGQGLPCERSLFLGV